MEESTDPMPCCKDNCRSHNGYSQSAADSPEISLGLACVGDPLDVHSKVGGEEGQRKEDDGDDGEDVDCRVPRLGDGC